MALEREQAEHITFFVEKASSLRGAALENVIVEATSHSSVFAFSEILAVPSNLQLEGTESSSFLDLLHIYAHGTWREYQIAANRLPQLASDQVLKLKQLTLLTLTETMKELPYDTLKQELDIFNVRELEDFLINCVDAGIVKGRLNQLRSCFVVQYTAGRDLKPGQLGNMIQKLENWLSMSDNLLVLIQEKINWVESMHEMDKKHKMEVDLMVKEVTSALILEDRFQKDNEGSPEYVLDIGEIPPPSKRRRDRL